MDPCRPSRRPPYPALPTSSATSSSSAFQHSTSSITSTQSAHSASSATGSDQSCSSPLDRHYSHAPLPSPTVSQGAFFGSLGQMSQQQMLQLQQLQQLQQQQQQQQQSQGQQMAGYQYQPDRSGAGATAQETNSYINQYALLAEAAKRAEMAVLERDLDGFELR
jgi:hypothetical protein